MYRTPLTSRRNNGNNLPAGQQKVPGLILPQAPYHLGSLQQQHLQHNGVSLYSPRGKPSVHTAALQGQAPASARSPRQARRMVSKDHNNPSKGLMGTSPPSNLANPVAHAAPAAGRPALPALRHETSQQQSQLYSPRRYAVPAPLEGLSPRAALHWHHTGGAGSHAQPAGGSSTWRGPLDSPRVQHAAAHSQQLSKHQSLQSSPSILPASRSALCTNLRHSDSIHLFMPCLRVGRPAPMASWPFIQLQLSTLCCSCLSLLLFYMTFCGKFSEQQAHECMHVDTLHDHPADWESCSSFVPVDAIGWHVRHSGIAHISLVGLHTLRYFVLSGVF